MNDKVHKIIYTILVIAVCFNIGFFYLKTSKSLGVFYEQETENVVIELKRVFLRNTVNNLIEDLEAQKQFERSYYSNIVDRYYDYYNHSNTQMATSQIVSEIMREDSFDSMKTCNKYGVTFVIWNTEGEPIFDPENLCTSHVDEKFLDNIHERLSYFKMFERSGVNFLFGVSKELIDNKVKTIIGEKIRDAKFDNNSYIWVNEVVDYDGGDNYAIRRIHPNLPETEGMFLSTSMEDIKGSLPYLEELEGVKNYGELFFNYYFKELNNDTISEKLTYAKLYKDYDWIIAMGVQNNEMERYISSVNEKVDDVIQTKIMQLLIILLGVVVAGFLIILRLEKRRFKNEKNRIEQEVSYDLLTNAKSRNYGVTLLKKVFDDYRKDGLNNSVAIMLLDIDKFKTINDTYGHGEGDRVLRKLVETIKESIRNTDDLIRWGGDEFVGVFRNITAENIVALGEKILLLIDNIKIPEENSLRSLSVSIGISFFADEDTNFEDCIKRADQAMYQSKDIGGNKITIC